MITSLGDANVLIILPAGTRRYSVGMEVAVILLEDQEGMSIEMSLSKETNKKGSLSYG